MNMHENSTATMAYIHVGLSLAFAFLRGDDERRAEVFFFRPPVLFFLSFSAAM